jgi:drug/metabolite transporter (DMT)-like permease
MEKNKPKASSQKGITPIGIANLLVVYFVWGSTYLAIRVGIRSGAGFEPFWFGGLRVLAAAVILIGWGLIRRNRILPSRRDIIVLAAAGFLLWIGGNGLVIIAEKRVDSSLAALIVSITPIWVAVIDSILDKRLPSFQFALALITGFGGVLLLSYPVLSSGIRADILSVMYLFLATISWSSGLVLQTRRPVDLSRGVSSGYQQLFGGIFYVLIALMAKEHLPTPTTEAWLAWGYLVIFGSLLAFTSFVTALQLLPTSIVTTYAYVNPVIAVLLGWLILGEPVTIWTLGGGLLVLLGVMGIFRDNKTRINSADT